MGSEFVRERHFTSLHTLEESGEAVRRRQMGSELDLNNFARFTVEDPVAQIIERLSEDNTLRHHFVLKGWVKFENHSNKRRLLPPHSIEDEQGLVNCYPIPLVLNLVDLKMGWIIHSVV